MTKRPDNLLILDIKGAIDSVRIFLKGKRLKMISLVTIYFSQQYPIRFIL